MEEGKGVCSNLGSPGGQGSPGQACGRLAPQPPCACGVWASILPGPGYGFPDRKPKSSTTRETPGRCLSLRPSGGPSVWGAVRTSPSEPSPDLRPLEPAREDRRRGQQAAKVTLSWDHCEACGRRG